MNAKLSTSCVILCNNLQFSRIFFAIKLVFFDCYGQRIFLQKIFGEIQIPPVYLQPLKIESDLGV